MKRLSRHLVATYLSIDPRSLGLFRIVFGLVLLADLLRRYLGVDYWYTEDGLVPTSLTNRGAWLFRLSIFNLAETHTEAMALMALCGVIFGLFTIGYKTRLFHLLSLVCVVSLNNRIFMLENGGQYVLNLLCSWTLFLPLGRRFSVDALLGSLRTRRERTPEELLDRSAMRTVDRPVVSLAVLALLLQFAVIYFFNAVQKSGEAWREGSAVHFALWWDQLVTVGGLWMRELLPYPVTQFLTYGTLVMEGAAVVLLLSPLWPRQCRLLAIALLPALHLGFNLALSLGIFSLAMISFYALLPSAADREWWDRVRRGRGRRKVAYFDAECGICFMFARVFARLDPWGRVRFVSNREGPLLAVPPGLRRRCPKPDRHQCAARAGGLRNTGGGPNGDAATTPAPGLAARPPDRPARGGDRRPAGQQRGLARVVALPAAGLPERDHLGAAASSVLVHVLPRAAEERADPHGRGHDRRRPRGRSPQRGGHSLSDDPACRCQDADARLPRNEPVLLRLFGTDRAGRLRLASRRSGEMDLPLPPSNRQSSRQDRALQGLPRHGAQPPCRQRPEDPDEKDSSLRSLSRCQEATHRRVG
jgi:hypothetical protein